MRSSAVDAAGDAPKQQRGPRRLAPLGPAGRGAVAHPRAGGIVARGVAFVNGTTGEGRLASGYGPRRLATPPPRLRLGAGECSAPAVISRAGSLQTLPCHEVVSWRSSPPARGAATATGPRRAGLPACPATLCPLSRRPPVACITPAASYRHNISSEGAAMPAMPTGIGAAGSARRICGAATIAD